MLAHQRVPLAVRVEAQPLAERSLDRLPSAAVGNRVAGGHLDPALGLGESVVVDHEGALFAVPVRVREDVLVDPAARIEDVVEQEVGDLGEEVPGDGRAGRSRARGVRSASRPGIRRGRRGGTPCRTSRRSPRPGRARSSAGPASWPAACETPKYLSPFAELVDRRPLVRVAHEVDIALEDFGVEFQRVLHDPAVAGVLLVAEHVHERAVVDAVHAERPDEVALQQPERLGQQQRVRGLRPPRGPRPPARTRWACARRRLSRVMACSARDGIAPPWPGSGNQSRWMWRRARVIAASKRMIGNWRATWRIVWMTASRTTGFEVVQLRRVVPRHARAVVAVVDVAGLAGPVVGALEDDRRVGGVPVVILDLDRDPIVVAEIAAGEASRPDRASRGAGGTSPGCSMTQRESMPMWLGTMSELRRMPRAAQRSRRFWNASLAAQVVGDACSP